MLAEEKTIQSVYHELQHNEEFAHNIDGFLVHLGGPETSIGSHAKEKAKLLIELLAIAQSETPLEWKYITTLLPNETADEIQTFTNLQHNFLMTITPRITQMRSEFERYWETYIHTSIDRAPTPEEHDRLIDGYSALGGVVRFVPKQYIADEPPCAGVDFVPDEVY